MPAALITGSSRGIGRAIATRYAEDGYDVVVNYARSADAAQNTTATIRDTTGSDAIAVQGDVGDPDQASTLVETAVDEFGGLDHVVNNAAINDHVYTPDLSPDEFNRVMTVNLTGAFTVSKHALPHLRESTADPSPSIVNLSSRLAFAGAAYECHYASSKAGIVALSKSHAREFAPDVRVNTVAPGFVETDMTDATMTEAEKRDRRETIPVGRLGKPADIADAAAYLRAAGYVTGETLQVNGGQLMD